MSFEEPTRITVDQSNTYKLNRSYNSPNVFGKAIIATIVVLLLNYSTEFFLYLFIMPDQLAKSDTFSLQTMLGGFSLYFIGHFIVSVILIALFEIPRKRIKFRWWHIMLLIFICYPASIATKMVYTAFAKLYNSIDPGDYSVFSGLANYPSMLMVMLAYGLIVLWTNAQNERENTLRTEIMLKEAKWQMLRYQVNPHFLFNSLNSIMALVNKDQDLARSMINELSNYFRHTLSLNGVTVIPLSREMPAVYHYLAIQKVRFEDRLEYKVDISAGNKDLLIPVFGLQTLVENAVKYGLKTTDNVCHVEINVSKQGGYDVLKVVNTGRLITSEIMKDKKMESSTNSGLANLTGRLNILYPDQYRFLLTEKNGNVEAIIKIEYGARPSI